MRKMSLMVVLSILASLIVAALNPLSTFAEEPAKPVLAPRGFTLFTNYPSITAGKGQDISFPLELISKGQSDEVVEVKLVTVPQGWETTLKDRGYGINSLYLLTGKTQYITLQAKPDAKVETGKHKLVLQASSADGAIKSTLDLNINIESKPLGGLKLTTMYPEQQGPSTSKFQFKVDVVNEGDEERSIGLAAAAPKDWQVTIKPSYEDKQIATLKLKAGESKGLDIDITPASKAEPGEYPVEVQASFGSLKETIGMKVNLLGTYELAVGTLSGRLNAEASAGNPTTVSIVVSNKGSGELRNLSFFSSKPDGWEVTFNPDKIDSLAAGDSREINATIKPSGKAIAGDYVVTLTASSASASERAQLRVTVETPTLWGWAGIILVVVVIAGLGGLFTRLGRR